MQHFEHLGQYATPVWPLLCKVAHGLEQRPRIALQQRLQHPIDLAVIEAAEHGPHVGGHHFAFAKGNSLVGQAHGIAHRPIGSATEQPQRVGFERHVFGRQYMAQVLDHTLRAHVLQRELQATRQDGRRQLLRVGGGEDELNVGRWLFQRLEQGVERVRGQHVHFVDQVNLEAPAARCVLHVIEQLAGVLDLGPAGSVDLDQVDEAALVDLPAHRTRTAGRGGNARLTVEAFGDDPRNGGLAHAARTSEQVGMVQALVVQGIDQGLEHMGLADHFAERARTPFTCKNLITHRKTIAA